MVRFYLLTVENTENEFFPGKIVDDNLPRASNPCEFIKNSR